MDAGISHVPSTLDDYDIPITKSALEAELHSSISRKQGHVCCGCCCDTRRAVLVVNILQLVITLGVSILLLVGKEFVQLAASKRLDDVALQKDEQELSQTPIGLFLMLWICQMIMYGCGILGAIQFHPPLIWVAIAAYILGFGIATWYGHVVSMVVNLVFIYPHVIFLKEMKRLIMTPENYPNEVHSFCCV